MKVTKTLSLNRFVVRLAFLGLVWQQEIIPKRKPPVGRVVLIVYRYKNAERIIQDCLIMKVEGNGQDPAVHSVVFG